MNSSHKCEVYDNQKIKRGKNLILTKKKCGDFETARSRECYQAIQSIKLITNTENVGKVKFSTRSCAFPLRSHLQQPKTNSGHIPARRALVGSQNRTILRVRSRSWLPCSRQPIDIRSFKKMTEGPDIMNNSTQLSSLQKMKPHLINVTHTS
jgi:hypothetical protein